MATVAKMAPKHLSRKHFEMSSLRLNNGFRLQKKKQQQQQTGPPDAKTNLRKSHFIMCHVTKYSASISAALARGFSDRHFERGEGPGDRGCGHFVLSLRCP